MNCGKRIKALRCQSRLTQDELGEKLGVKKAAVQKYENGLIVNLKVDTIKKLAEIFKVSPSYIMGWDKFDENSDLNKIQKEIALAELVDELLSEKDKTIFSMILKLSVNSKDKLLTYINDLYKLDKLT